MSIFGFVWIKNFFLIGYDFSPTSVEHVFKAFEYNSFKYFVYPQWLGVHNYNQNERILTTVLTDNFSNKFHQFSKVFSSFFWLVYTSFIYWYLFHLMRLKACPFLSILIRICFENFSVVFIFSFEYIKHKISNKNK